jgi:hypothetical protein
MITNHLYLYQHVLNDMGIYLSKEKYTRLENVIYYIKSDKLMIEKIYLQIMFFLKIHV